MAATAAEIRNKALRRLGILGLGQTASSELSNDVDAAYNEVYARLSEVGLVGWALASSVPNEYVAPMVALVAGERVDEYGVAGERYQRIKADAAKAEMDIRRLINGQYVSRSVEATYY